MTAELWKRSLREIGLEVLGNLSHQPLKWHLAEEQLGGLLVPPDLPQGNSSGPVPVWLLHSASSWSTLPGSFGGQLLPWGLPSGGLASSLLSSCHAAR